MENAENIELSVKRAISALDQMAETWANEVNLTQMVAAITERPDRESHVEHLVKQAFAEGLYRAWTAHQEALTKSGGSDFAPKWAREMYG